MARPTPDGSARQLPCTRGLLVDHPVHGVHALHGSLFVYWRDLGGFGSDLGALLGDHEVPADPTAPQTARFERGTLSWTPERGAWRS